MKGPTDRFNFDEKERSRSSKARIEEFGPTRTQVHMQEEVDINTIVKRFGLTGQLPTSVRTPNYGDFTGVVDYQTALNTVMEAENLFSALPAEIRKRFENDPQQYLEFCENPDNIEELRKLGLAKPAEVVSVPQEPMQPPAEPSP